MSEQRKALIVAVDRYDHPSLRELAAPAADARELAAVLGDPDLGAFDVDVLANAESWRVAEAVEALLSEARPADLILLSFSCHGIKDDSGELFLAATNTVPTRLFATAVHASVVNRLIQRSRAQRVVLFLDCCYGGAFERGVVARSVGDVDVGDHFSAGTLGTGRGRVVITASSAMEYAFEGAVLADQSGPSPSLFTSAVVEGIKSGEADRDQDGQIALTELYDFVHDSVQLRTPNQTPCKWEFGVQGDLIIARNPVRKVRASPLRDDIAELVVHPNAGVRLTAVDELRALMMDGDDLSAAAGARAALGALRTDDSRRVSAAAVRTYDEGTLTLRPSAFDLGAVPPGEHRVRAEVWGGPLARASAARTTSNALAARLDSAELEVIVTVEPAAHDGNSDGASSGVVEVKGPAGEADVVIRWLSSNGSGEPATRVLPIPVQPRATPIPSPPTNTVASGADHRPHRSAPPRWLIAATVLCLLGASAFVAALFGAYQLGGVNTIRPVGRGWLLMAPVACGAAVIALWSDRRRASVVAIIVAAALWTWLFYLRVVAALIEDHISAASFASGSWQNRLWMRLAAAVLLSAAAVLLVRRSAQLSVRPVVAVRLASATGAAVTLVAVFLNVQHALLVDRSHALYEFQAAYVVVVMVPLLVLRLDPAQRVAALLGATSFAAFVAVPDLWDVVFHHAQNGWPAVGICLLPLAAYVSQRPGPGDLQQRLPLGGTRSASK